MNPFFDISDKEELPIDSLALRNLGLQQVLITMGRRASDLWGARNTSSKTLYRNTTDEDYDHQFVYKLHTWKPVYNIDQVIEYHYDHYRTIGTQRGEEFLKHMRYVILPILKKRKNSGVHVQLFEKWLDKKDAQNNASFEPSPNQIPQSGVINKTVHRIHFDDLSWSDFERLVFAYVKRLRSWKSINWLGQSGQDEGQDIWGESQGHTYCYLCANYKALTLKKAKDDIDKLAKFNSIPDHLIVVCGGRVAARTNKSINSYARDIGINSVEVWSGADIEENMRIHAPDLLKRFFEGNDFPEIHSSVWSDAKIIEELVNCFNRPAFTTPFHREVNIPDFGKAIIDTIEVLNTGIHRLRDGTLIKQIPSRHQIKDNKLKNRMNQVYDLVVELRDTFTELRRKKEIQSCKCDEPDCPIYMLSENACKKMDDIRQQIFTNFRALIPNIALNIYQ